MLGVGKTKFMNIAILIGISKYADKVNDLPGCKKDLESMKKVLEATNKYDKLITLESNLSSNELKESLTNFIIECKGNLIDECFLYFTGHGEFYQNEFYYLLSDYTQEKRRQTSLQNSEIDVQLKSLSPNIVIKVIDACQSGVSYIKDISEPLNKYLQNTANSFNKCYFFYSSLYNQYSYQNNDMSDFTASFIKSIIEGQNEVVRYKDIISFISDDFENNQNQTPFFVNQADFTEIFHTFNTETKESIKLSTKTDSSLPKQDEPQNNNQKYSSIVDVIKQEALLYCEEKEVLELFEKIKVKVANLNIIDDLVELHNLKITFPSGITLPKADEIGEWLDKNTKHLYFAEPNFRTIYRSKSGYYCLQNDYSKTRI